jgi:hypothetical protein
LSSGLEEQFECLYLIFKGIPVFEASLGGLSIATRGGRGNSSQRIHRRWDRGRHPSQYPIALCDQGLGSHCHSHLDNLEGESSSQ